MGKFELSLHANDLKNVAGIARTSDPFAVVTYIASEGEKAKMLGKTEEALNNLSPRWIKVLTFDYEPEADSRLVITVYDQIKKGKNKTMGTAVMKVQEVLEARGQTLSKKFVKGGTLFANVRESVGEGKLYLQMKGIKLKNQERGLLAKSDPFFELSRKVDNAGALTWDNVYRSKFIKNDLNPEWAEDSIELSILCGGDYDAPILIQVFDHEGSGKHKPMGQFEASVNELIEASTDGDDEDVESAFTLKKTGKETGKMIVLKATDEEEEEEKVVEVVFINTGTNPKYDETTEIYWYNEDDDDVEFLGPLGPDDDDLELDTYVGHKLRLYVGEEEVCEVTVEEPDSDEPREYTF